MEEPYNKAMESFKKKKLMKMNKRLKNLTKEQLKAAMEKKKVCNSKAMAVVERLIEPQVDASWLLEKLYDINQSHYQDAVEERAIIKCCGYPLCDNSLDVIPKKQFHISTKQNKVFDITDRKNYCSNFCYKASTYLKEQMYTSPLWLRDCEDDVEFNLYTPAKRTGSTGVEVDLGNVDPVKSDGDLEKHLSENIKDLEKSNNVLDGTSTCASIPNNFNCTTQSSLKIIEETNKSSAVNECIVENKAPRGKNIEERKRKDIGESDRSRKIKSSSKKEDFMISIGDRINGYLDSWFTVNTLCYLLGDDKVRGMCEEFGTPTVRFGQLINTKDAFIYERYTEICKRLNLVELMEKKVEEKTESIPTKPLPDFEVLKSETKELEIKVKSFYLGDKKVLFQETNESDVVGEQSDKNDPSNEKTITPILPLIDKHCVMATRRRIVLDKIFKTLPDIQSALGLGHINIRHEVQEFVHTLSLSASNITMSPSEWNLIAIIIIKLFTLRNELLDGAFKTDHTQKRVINLLLSFRLDLFYLQNCVAKLTDMEQIIKNSE